MLLSLLWLVTNKLHWCFISVTGAYHINSDVTWTVFVWLKNYTTINLFSGTEIPFFPLNQRNVWRRVSLLFFLTPTHTLEPRLQHTHIASTLLISFTDWPYGLIHTNISSRIWARACFTNKTGNKYDRLNGAKICHCFHRTGRTKESPKRRDAEKEEKNGRNTFRHSRLMMAVWFWSGSVRWLCSKKRLMNFPTAFLSVQRRVSHRAQTQ